MNLAVRAPLSQAQEIREALLTQNAIDFSRKPSQEGDYLIIPVLRHVDEYEMVEATLPERPEPTPDLRTALQDVLSAQEQERLKTAFDVLGDVAILEIDEELRHQETVIAETLLELQPAIRTVVRKAGAHQGELRLQDYVHLAGEKRFETTVIENSVRLTLDIRKTYYSVRSATERKRVASLVQPDERVLVMFSGIAPFPLVIAKLSEAKEVIGVELNEDAHGYAEKNVAQNKMAHVHVVQGDVREVVPTLGTFDRIAMPLPHTAQDFLDVAVPACNPGATIHLYHFSTEEEVQAFARTLPERIAKLRREGTVTDIVKCGNLGPGIHRWSIDIHIQ